jgi:hypothetical protein
MRSTDYPKPHHFIYKPHHQAAAVTFFFGLMVGTCLSVAVVFWIFVWSFKP